MPPPQLLEEWSQLFTGFTLVYGFYSAIVLVPGGNFIIHMNIESHFKNIWCIERHSNWTLKPHKKHSRLLAEFICENVSTSMNSHFFGRAHSITFNTYYNIYETYSCRIHWIYIQNIYSHVSFFTSSEMFS